MHDVSNEPRDEHGRWTSTASALGDDLNHPNLTTLKDAVDRGAWNIGVTKVENDWSGGKTTTFSIMPKVVPAGWQSFKDGSRVSFYNPTLAHVEQMTPGYSHVIPNSPEQSTFPIEKGEPGTLYRGMSYEEYQNALSTGSFKSRGGYNLGEEEKGLTYFSTDPLQASAYANGFAPWPYIAAPGSPAIVVSIKDPGNHIVNAGRSTEIGIRDNLPTSAITAIYVGHPVIADSGMQEVRQDRGRAPQTGSGMSPRTSVIWEKQEAPGSGRSNVTNTPEFKAWFGNSKVVDADGKPMVVYHGSANKFETFDPTKSGNVQYSDWGKGIYLTPSKSTADYYRTEAVKHADPAYNAAYARFEALEKALPPVSDTNSTPAYTEESRQALREFQDIGAKLNKTTEGQVYEVYAAIKNPWVEPYSSIPDPFLAERAKAHGNDGLFIMSGSGEHIDEIIAFSPEQVKSAKGNTTFEPTNPNINYEGALPPLLPLPLPLPINPELGHGYSKDAHLINGVIHTDNVNDAVRALYENKKVELNQPREVATVLNELGQVAKTFIQLGKSAPNFNLCNVSVADTNLFCAQSKGIPRIKMPQLADPEKFRTALEAKGIKVTDGEENASYLRASQNELVGVKVAAIAQKLKTGEMKLDEERLFISRDNYIVDGHHRWAGVIGFDAMNNKLGDVRMKVARVDMDIIPLLDEANKFSGPRKSGTEAPPPPLTGAKSAADFLAKQRAASLSGGPINVRDFGERWTATSVGNSGAHAHPAGPFMDISKPDQAEKADQVAKIAAEVANKLGFEPTSVNVSDEHKTFELNGRTLNTAGWASRPPGPSPTVNPDGSKQIIGGGTGTVTLFTPHVGNDPAGIAGVMAHEVSHQKYNAFLSDKEADSIRMKNDPDWSKETKWVTYDPSNPVHVGMSVRGDVVTTLQADGEQKIRDLGFMRPDGLLNEPYASRYPAYQAYTKVMMPGIEAFAKSDGVSGYSKEYWLGARTAIEKEYTQTLDGVTTGTGQKYKTYAVNPETAFSETIAEIGRLKYSKDPIYHNKLGEVDGKPVYFSTGKKGLKPEWGALYRAVDENWKRRNSK
jgi:hypothetical protein